MNDGTSDSQCPCVAKVTDPLRPSARAGRMTGTDLASFGTAVHALLVSEAFDAPYEPEKFTDGLGWSDPPESAVAAIQTVMTALEADIVSYPEYGGGLAFHRVGPGGRSGLLADLAKRSLAPHTDLPHLRLPTEASDGRRERAPDITILACVRGDGVTSTFSADLGQTLARLPAKTVSLLIQPAFSVRTPSAWMDQGRFDDVPCVCRVGSEYVARLSPNLMHSPSAPHQGALDALVAAASKDIMATVLREGDLLILDNLKQFHGRGTNDGSPNRERTLIRTYGTYHGDESAS
jgi:hypothetical protein